ncbi:MAG: hypothetical protein PHS81_04625, partial [Candidatus Nanoarchaeia archaeon]|nr:hypothetical protein [Candidatus Nanoarchaeia archaeon]
MKKTEIPVESLYILSFLVLMSLAGTSLYFYMEGQSTARNYRMSAALILEESESLKLMVDQERQFVLETVIFFLGSQGGVANIAEYNEYNLTLIDSEGGSDLECINAMKEMAGGIYPSPEVLSMCVKNPENYNHQDNIGAWKCDDMIYSYEVCTEYEKDGISMNPSICCESGNEICNEGCLSAIGFDAENYCAKKTYCGALLCKENFLEIPESYTGVQYYYKIGEQSPGYSCESILSFNPELNYDEQELWTGADSSEVIANLIDLSNKYFYLPHPDFTSYIRRVYDIDLKLAFQLKYKGCNNRFCEFAWVPYGDYEQGFTARGVGGIPLMTVSSELISLQMLEVPMLDMLEYSKSMIEQKEITSYFAQALQNQTMIIRENVGYFNLPQPSDWKTTLSQTLGISPDNSTTLSSTKSMIYDDYYCEENPYNTTNYECIMQHASTKIYETIKNPIRVQRNDGYDYQLRPVFNFIKTSIGASVQGINTCGNGVCEFGETEGNCPEDCADLAISRCYAQEDNDSYAEYRFKGCSSDFSGIWDYYDSSLVQNKDESNCNYLRAKMGCEAGACGDGICDLNENHLDCPDDCVQDATQASFEIILDSGKYAVFVRGTGNASGKINILGTDYEFNINSAGEYYEQIKKADDAI